MKINRRFLTILIVVVSASGLAFYIYFLQQNPSYGNINIERAKKLIDEDSGLVIVDVRTPVEYITGHIEGAINLCIDCDPQKLLDDLDPENRILLYCRAGVRSANALAFLKDNDYKKVYNMVGGIEAWIDAGYTVTNS